MQSKAERARPWKDRPPSFFRGYVAANCLGLPGVVGIMAYRGETTGAVAIGLTWLLTMFMWFVRGETALVETPPEWRRDGGEDAAADEG